MRVLHAQSFPRWIRELFQVEFTAAGIDVIWYDDISDTPWDTFTDVEVLLTSKQYISKEMMSSLASLKLVQVQGRAPWAVDWRAAREVGIPVSVLPHRGAIAVAEQTISLMLGCYRRLVDGHLGTRDGEYLDLDLDPIKTNERKIAFNCLKFAPGSEYMYLSNFCLVGSSAKVSFWSREYIGIKNLNVKYLRFSERLNWSIIPAIEIAKTVWLSLISGASKEVTSVDVSTPGETTFTLLVTSLATSRLPSLIISTIILKS